MRDRTKVLLGSAAGAIAIHVAFLACGTPTLTRDSGHDSGITDAMGDVADRETGTADAQGMPCNCAPALPPATFHFVPPAGMTVRSDYSTAFVSAGATLLEGVPGVSATVLGSFYLNDANSTQGQLSCSLGVIRGTVRTAACTLNMFGVASYQTTATAGITATVTDTTIAVDIPSLALAQQGASSGDAGLQSITLTNVQFRGAGRDLLAVPSRFIRQ